MMTVTFSSLFAVNKLLNDTVIFTCALIRCLLVIKEEIRIAFSKKAAPDVILIQVKFFRNACKQVIIFNLFDV